MRHPDLVPIGRIVDRIWGVTAPPSAVTSVRNHVARIRRVAPGLVETAGSTYRLVESVRLSWGPDGAGHDVVLADLADTDEVMARRHIIEERLASETDADLALAVSTDPSAGTIARLRLAVEEHPYREARWGLLALAQARAGRRREAMLTLQEVRRHLAEVGLDPGDRLLRVEQQIVHDQPIDPRMLVDLGAAPSAAPTIIHPHHDEPFAGRSAALDRLAASWSDTVGDHRPRLVVIEGAAGSGKTRVVDRFVQLVCADGSAPRVIWGRNRAHANRAHGALAEALGRLAAFEPDLFERRTTTSGLLHLAAQTEDEHPPGATDGPGAGDGVARTRLGRELARLVQVIGRRPTIWLLDDVQWASPDSIALMEEAFDGATGAILLVATTRLGPRPQADVFGSLGRVLPVATLSMEPLGIPDLDDLLQHFSWTGLSETETAELYRRTGGLALYVSEVIRLARLTGTLDPDTTPIALQEWIRHRVEALDDATREHAAGGVDARRRGRRRRGHARHRTSAGRDRGGVRRVDGARDAHARSQVGHHVVRPRAHP